ncbi:VRR-NUC domain-containing protein [Paenibacillus woosongensis]|uniref:VRR-NUC domain-containing protein n=1 Tax=Paenibacillus woosongensis TaxID=307580 RepID=A0AA95I7B9_9BACL|nr:VRR-NUC domain-containing protein [Paenibacillus woosongensis]WHX50536.1 VRR-NUC domain-containing protein [Paenibacillus woosongensis]
MRERDIETYLRERVKEAGGWAPKWTSPGNNGVPDRIVFLPGGHIVFVELKAPGAKPRPVQLAQHKRIRSYRQDVRVIDSRQQVDELLQELMRS